MRLFKPKAQEPTVTCRTREVAIFQMGNRVNLKQIVHKAKKHGALRVMIFYHENAIEIKYFTERETQGLDSDIIMTEMFPYNANNESIFIKMKAAGLSHRSIEQREHGEYSNVRQLNEGKQVPFVDHQVKRLAQPQSQIKHMDGDFAKRVAEGWEEQKKGVKQQ